MKHKMVENTDYIGIDYGNGLTNIDLKTGIRYGIISLQSVSSDFLDEFEPEYPEIEDRDDESALDFCEPLAFNYDSPTLKCSYTPDGLGLWVFYSETIIKCAYCSPCAPGAGDLNALNSEGVKTYALPDDYLAKN